MRCLVPVVLACLLLGSGGPSAASAVSLAPDGMIEVEGKRLFVIGLYEHPQEDTVLDAVAKAGVNLIHTSEDAGAIDRIHQRGMYVWLNTGGRIEIEDSSPEQTRPLKEMVERWGKHPALLVWEVPDEALWSCMLGALGQQVPFVQRWKIFQENSAALSARMKAGYAVLKDLDPDHPVWMNHAAGNQLEDLIAINRAADIVGCDLYPLMPYPWWPVDVSRSVIGAIGPATLRMQAAAPGKPVWMVLQGMSWADIGVIFPKRPGTGQYPTFEESRFMAYDAIACGARGVLYWGTYTVGKDSPFWHDLLRVTRELADHQALLSAPDAAVRPVVETAETEGTNWFSYHVLGAYFKVRALGKQVEDKTWWIVVNEMPTPCAYTLRGMKEFDGHAYEDPVAGIRMEVNGGSLEGVLPANSVHILRPAPG